ncbi:MAG TPA: phosphoribosyltransferase family protein [Blastocatellia bacterium]|nr:phosphoribosyltransferase family protein [Blastocatellia bacterium]
MQHYRDRTEAGWRLAVSLAAYFGRPDVLALAMTRGGAPVAYEVAQALDAQLDVFLAREILVPGHEDRRLGVVSSDGFRSFNDHVAQRLGIVKEKLESLAAAAQEELKRLEHYYRSGRAAPDLRNRIVILVDDGLSSGSMIKTAARALRQWRPARLIIAIPVIAASTLAEFRSEADQVICAVSPKPFAVANSLYDEAAEPSDQEVRDMIERARRQRASPPASRVQAY